MGNLKNITTLLTVFLSSVALGNAPVKYSHCPINVKAPKGSQGHFWSENCQKLYVLPSMTNKISVNNMLINATKHECKIIDDINKNYKAQRKFLVKQLNYVRSSAYKADQEFLDEEKNKQTNLQSALDYQMEILKSVDSNFAQIREKISETEQKMEALDQNSIEYLIAMNNLSSLKMDLEQLRPGKSALEFKIANFQKQIDRTIEKISNKQKEIESKSMQDDLIYEKIKSNLAEQANDLIVDKYLKETGAIANVVLSNKSMDLVRLYKIYNPHIISIEPMPLVKTRLKFTSNLLKENNLLAIIGGAQMIGQANGATYNQYEVPFSGAVNATINIDKYTACSLGQYRLKSQIDSVVNANFYYEYDLMVNAHYELTYNLSEVFKKIKKHTKRNGIFVSRNSKSMVQDLKKSESFDFKFYSQDISLEVKEEKKDFIISTFIDRALKSVGVSYVSYQRGTTLALPGEIQAGATRAADMLESKCQNEYCQYASLALNIAHALFGGSDQSDSFISSQNFVQTETYDYSTVIRHYGSAGFSK